MAEEFIVAGGESFNVRRIPPHEASMSASDDFLTLKNGVAYNYRHIAKLTISRKGAVRLTMSDGAAFDFPLRDIHPGSRATLLAVAGHPEMDEEKESHG
jgi:hypothetical protein